MSFPLNSVGVLPIDYLDNSEPYKVNNLVTNAKQILAQYQINEQMKRESSLVFRQFPELTGGKIIFCENLFLQQHAEK